MPHKISPLEISIHAVFKENMNLVELLLNFIDIKLSSIT